MDHIHPLNPLSSPHLPLVPPPPSNRTCFTFLQNVYLFKGFHCSISHLPVLYINQIIPLYYSLFLCPPSPLLFSSFHCASLCYLHTQMQCILILFTLCHSLFLSHLPLVHLNSLTITNILYINTQYMSMYVFMHAFIF
jgi:hypothetical protein